MMESKRVVWMSLVVVLLAVFVFGGAPAAVLAKEPAPVHIVFVSTRARLTLGECALLEWHVEGGYQVNVDGQPVPPMGHKEVCPQRSRVFRLEVDMGDRIEARELAIVVEGQGPSAPYPPAPQPAAPNPTPQHGVTINFRADRTNLKSGECTVLRWDVEHAIEVYLDGQGVVGHSARQVCPKVGRTFVLHVVHAGGNTEKKVTIQVNGGGAPPQPNPNPGPGKPQVDLAVTDLYPDNLPKGAIWVRVTNHGPATLSNAQIQLKCNAYGKPLNGQKPWSHVEAPWQRTVSLGPGQTVALKTNIVVDTTKYQWTASCSAGPPPMVGAFSDPNNSNNVLSESYAGQAQPKKQAPFVANVAVTDLFAKNVKGGKLFARITNHGPGTLKNAQVSLVCQGAGFQGNQPTVIKGGGKRVLNLSPGQTAITEAGIVINTNQYSYYEMTCSVVAPFAGNNAYSELIK